VDDALAEADAAVERAAAEDKLYCRRNRAHILSEAGRQAQAIAECEALLQEYTKAAEIHDIRYLLSGIYTNARNYAKAEEQLQWILKEHKDDATAHNDLGYIWADQNKNLEAAEKLIRRAIELDRKQRSEGTHVSADSDQDNAAYIDSLGWVLFRRGQFQAARQELEKAATLPGGSEDPVIWDHLGDVYLRLEEPARARTAWKKAVEMHETGRRRPTDDRYKEIKQKLKLLKP
jgi:Flp pilus assembly protein TadD